MSFAKNARSASVGFRSGMMESHSTVSYSTYYDILLVRHGTVELFLLDVLYEAD